MGRTIYSALPWPGGGQSRLKAALHEHCSPIIYYCVILSGNQAVLGFHFRVCSISLKYLGISKHATICIEKQLCRDIQVRFPRGTHYPGLRTEIQSCKVSEPSSITGKGDCNRPAPAILLALHFLCMTLGTHIRSNTYRILRILRMQVCIEHQHWANAQLMSCAIHARLAHARDEQGTSSRRDMHLHTTLRAELPGVGTGDHAIWEFNKGQESLLTTELWMSRRGYGTSSLSMDINSFLLVLLDAFSSRFFNTNVLFLYTLYSSFFFWCLVQSGLFLFLKLPFFLL